MQLQPSVIIWTVICFLLFMLVVDRLLFRPLLKHMDGRRERIARAGEKRAALERELEDERLTRKLEAEAARARAEAEARAELERAKAECEAELNAYAEELALYEKDMTAQAAAADAHDRELIIDALDGMAAEYADKLIVSK